MIISYYRKYNRCHSIKDLRVWEPCCQIPGGGAEICIKNDLFSNLKNYKFGTEIRISVLFCTRTLNFISPPCKTIILLTKSIEKKTKLHINLCIFVCYIDHNKRLSWYKGENVQHQFYPPRVKTFFLWLIMLFFVIKYWILVLFLPFCSSYMVAVVCQ